MFLVPSVISSDCSIACIFRYSLFPLSHFFISIFLEAFISLTIFTEGTVFIPEMTRYLCMLLKFSKHIEN